MADTARIFMTGRSQAVRLPLEYRFDVEEVYIRRGEKGEVILTPKPLTWEGFFSLYASTDVPEDYMLAAGSGRPEQGHDALSEAA